MAQLEEILDPLVKLVSEDNCFSDKSKVDKVTEILDKLNQELLRCSDLTCGGACLDRKNISWVKHDCKDGDVESMGLFPVLLKLVDLGKVEAVDLVRKGTMSRKWFLAPVGFLDAAFLALKKNNIKLTELFGWEWLMKLVNTDDYNSPDGRSERYAAYTYAVVEKMYRGEESSPALNRNMLLDLDFLFPEMPERDIRSIWGWLIKDINRQNYLDILGVGEGMKDTREKMITKYGVLWSIGLYDDGQARESVFRPLISYVLYNFLGHYRQSHIEWFLRVKKVRVYAVHLTTQAKALAQEIMRKPWSCDDKIFYRCSLSRAVAIPAVQLTWHQRSKMHIKDRCSLCQKRLSIDEEPLLEGEREYEF